MIRVVFDTNVLLDIFWFKDARVAEIARDLNRNIQWVVCHQTAREFEGVLARPLFLAEEIKAHDFASRALEGAEYFDQEIGMFPFCKDSEDDKFFNLAIASKAEFFITRDKLCLKARKKAARAGFTVLKPEAFLAALPS